MAALVLLIKSPNQQVADLQISCDTTWSISKLKDHLYDLYPTKPLPIQQRIIYSGRLLPDHLHLDEVLIKGLDTHIMHLVCPQSTNAQKKTSTLPETEQITKSLNKEPSPTVQDNVLPTVPDEGLRQRWMPQNNLFNMAVYNQGLVPPQAHVDMTTLPAPYMAYQMAALQQSYAQFMAQFLAQSQYIQPNVPSNAPMEVPSMQLLNRPIAEPQNLQNDVEPVARLHQNRRPFDAGQFDRDLHNALHLLSRIFILCIILYFYSTPEKVLLVLCLGFCVCFYRAFYSSFQRSRRTVEAQAEVEHPLEEDVDDIIFGHLRPVNEDEEIFTDQLENSESNSEPQLTSEENQESSNASRHGILDFPIVTFIKTFFTSLVPEQTIPLDA